MKKFKTLQSKVIPLWLNDIDTDMIIPAQYLTQTSKAGYGEHVFQRLKDSESNFVLNQERYKEGKILLSGNNFGCGSSREHAVWALQQSGIEIVIAPSFSDIFFNNSAKNGLLLIELEADIIKNWCELSEKGDIVLCVNLENEIILYNDKKYPFHYDAFRKECLLKGQDDLTFLLSKRDIIKNFELNRKK